MSVYKRVKVKSRLDTDGNGYGIVCILIELHKQPST